jgi:cytochrome c biogenesis protein CcmG/thiol:disulfide interchange protein DsbE
MGTQARLKRERRVARAVPPPVGKAKGMPTSRGIWLGTGGLVLVIAVIATILALRSPSSPPPPAQPSASDENAPPALVEAADAVGFRPTTGPGVGEIEDKPASAAGEPSNPNLLPTGTAAPGFTLRTPQGESVSLAEARGKAVLLEFFATWCPHCNAEAPHLRSIAESLDKARFAFVSVNADSEDAASVFAYHRYFGLPFPALLDPGTPAGSFHQPGGPGPVTLNYKVQAYPTFYVIDPKGRVFWATDGEQPDALIRAKLQAAARAG